MADFTFIVVPELRRGLERDYKELRACLQAEAWKAVHVLAGSIVGAANIARCNGVREVYAEQHKLLETKQIVVTEAQGSTIYDADGTAYLDAMAGLWCVNIGYGRPELADVAAEQMRQLSYYPHTAMNVPAAPAHFKRAGIDAGILASGEIRDQVAETIDHRPQVGGDRA